MESRSPLRAAKKTISATRGAMCAAAAIVVLCASGLAAAAAPVSQAPAKWTSGLSVVAALGAAFAIRRPRHLTRPMEYDSLVSLAGDFVAQHRIDGRVTAIEGNGVQMDPSALIGYGLVDQLHEEDRPLFLAQLCAVAADGRLRSATLRMRRPDGQYGRIGVRSALADQGALVSAFTENEPASHFVAELEAAREETKIERSLKDRLLANMSHELRTPLNAILGFSEILGDPALSPTDPEKRIEYARIIHTSADHLLSVVNLVLDMSRIEAGKFAVAPEPLELAPLIRECCDMLRLRAQAGQVDLIVSPLPEGLEIVADKGACRQIVVNLLSNAVKFTPPEGRVVIEASVEAGVARISVLDTGIGVKPDDLPRLGDPFFQVKSGYNRSFEGAGLGLSLVRGLVGLHGGSLVLESAFGVGTRVTVSLPLSPCVAGRASTARLETIPTLAVSEFAVEEEERRIA